MTIPNLTFEISLDRIIGSEKTLFFIVTRHTCAIWSNLPKSWLRVSTNSEAVNFSDNGVKLTMSAYKMLKKTQKIHHMRSLCVVMVGRSCIEKSSFERARVLKDQVRASLRIKRWVYAHWAILGWFF